MAAEVAAAACQSKTRYRRAAGTWRHIARSDPQSTATRRRPAQKARRPCCQPCCRTCTRYQLPRPPVAAFGRNRAGRRVPASWQLAAKRGITRDYTPSLLIVQGMALQLQGRLPSLPSNITREVTHRRGDRLAQHAKPVVVVWARRAGQDVIGDAVAGGDPATRRGGPAFVCLQLHSARRGAFGSSIEEQRIQHCVASPFADL